MSIYKKEYIDAQRKRNIIIAIAVPAFIVVAIIFYNILKK
jgi:hypothetical protein